MLNDQRGAVRSVMDMSLFLMLLLSGLLCSASGVSREFHYINTRMSWSEAQSYCRVKFTDLATVDSMNDVNRIINTVNDGYSGSVWIGLKRLTGRWVWSMGDTLALYSGWLSGEPNGDGACGEFVNGGWNDIPCSYNSPFVCYNESIGNTLIPSPKTWKNAQIYCRQYHTDLASIRSSLEQKQLANISASFTRVWLGLFVDAWQWSDKWNFFFRNWPAGQPSALGDCASMSTTDSGKWAVETCDLRHPFICHGSIKTRTRPYYYFNETMTWLNAQSYCRARFTDLATVDTMSDVSRMMNTVDPGNNGSVWIGLKRNTLTRWVWSTQNTTLSQYSNWSPGEPNGSLECVKSFGGSWFDVDCALTLPFVCFNDSIGYVYVNTPLTWRDAQTYCRQYHTDLASVRSIEQQRLISDKSSSVWIGLFLDSWLWSDQWSLNFRHWTTGQPSQTLGSGDCVAMSPTDSGKWFHTSCDQSFSFICYGDDKLIKKQLVKLDLSCRKCNLKDPSLQTVILSKINKKLQSLALPGRYTVRWGIYKP